MNHDLDRRDDIDPAPFWSPWATVAWGLLISATFVVVQGIVVAVWAAMRMTAGADGGAVAAELAADGDLIAVGTLASAVICGTLVLILASVKAKARPRQSLGLHPPAPTGLAGWLALTAILIVCSDLLTTALGKPIVPDFMRETVRTAELAPILWFAVIIAAPAFEELFVRGFLIEGLRRGLLGDAGAIVVTSLFWASIHVQYGMYEITTIFIFGLVLGLARIGSRSLWVPVAMHALANLVATVEAYVVATG